MNKQEIFNKVLTHLAKQGERSVRRIGVDINWDSCAYRGVNSAKCAIGCLIMDKFYRPEIEGKHSASDEVRDCLIQSGVLEESMKDEQIIAMFNFLVRVQELHDGYPVHQWERVYANLAKVHGLEMPDVDWSRCKATPPAL